MVDVLFMFTMFYFFFLQLKIVEVDAYYDAREWKRHFNVGSIA